MAPRFFAALALALSTLSLYAQDVDIDISKDGISIDTKEWYENPFVWAGVVALIVILLIVTRRGSKA